MSETDLTKTQKKQLEKLMEAIIRDAQLVVEDYEKNPSDLSGSIIQIHEDSPLLISKEERLLTDKKNDTE